MVVQPACLHLIAPISIVKQVTSAVKTQPVTKFNDMLIDCLANCPNSSADFDQIKRVLFERYKHELFVGAGERSFEHYIATDSGQ